MATKKNKQKSNKLSNYVNKKSLIRLGIALSLTANLVIAVIVILALVQSMQGKITSLSTNSALISSTCNNYFNKQTYRTGTLSKVDGVSFQPVYLKDTSNNACNRINLSSTFEQKTLLEVNKQNATNYYVNTTKLNTGYFATHPETVTIPIYYNENTNQPINLDTLDPYYP